MPRLSVGEVKRNTRSKVVPACMQMSKVKKQVTVKHEVFTAPLFTADNSPCNRINDVIYLKFLALDVIL